MMNQKTAVVTITLSVLKERGQDYELGGDISISDVLSDADKAKIRDQVFAGFRAGKIEMSEDSKPKYTEDKDLKSYVSGLVNNWHRKAKEFNSGAKYEAKNPGSRAGSGDEKIREMKKLLGQVTDPTAKKMIEEEIANRQEEIAATNAPTIDASKLPEALRHLVK